MPDGPPVLHTHRTIRLGLSRHGHAALKDHRQVIVESFRTGGSELYAEIRSGSIGQTRH